MRKTITQQDSENAKELYDLMIDDLKDNSPSLLEGIRNLSNALEQQLKMWVSEFQLDRNFDKDLNIINALETNSNVTEIDKVPLQKFVKHYNEIKEYRNYSDFENRKLILYKGKQDLTALLSMDIEGGTTLFIENYLKRYIRDTVKNLDNLILDTETNYKPELSLTIPLKKYPISSGALNISMTITNAENKASAKNIRLDIFNLQGDTLYTKKMGNLKGGATFSELANISINSNEEAFSIKLRLSYTDDEQNPYELEEKLSISMNLDNFEPIKNPYITGKPVENPEMFFGRDELVERLEQALKDDRTRCIVIYGQKRTGKSSIFNHLENRVIDDYIVLKFSAGADITSERDFYRNIQYGTIDYMEKQKYNQQLIDEFDKMEVYDQIGLERYIKKFSRQICSKEDKELLIMIDEFTTIFEYINNPKENFDGHFMDIWKAMIEKNLFKSALIGQDFMLDFIHAYPNQFQVTDPIYVSYLDECYALDLVTKPIALDNNTSRFLESSEKIIVDWFNGQPYYLQTYCSKLVDYLNEHQKQNYITVAIAQKVRDKMLQESDRSFFDNLVGITDKEGFQLVQKIASRENSIANPVNLALLDLSEEEQNTLDRLHKKRVVSVSYSSNNCKIVVPFFHEWLRTH